MPETSENIKEMPPRVIKAYGGEARQGEALPQVGLNVGDRVPQIADKEPIVPTAVAKIGGDFMPVAGETPKLQQENQPTTANVSNPDISAGLRVVGQTNKTEK